MFVGKIVKLNSGFYYSSPDNPVFSKTGILGIIIREERDVFHVFWYNESTNTYQKTRGLEIVKADSKFYSIINMRYKESGLFY